jgi:hypothetical protein
MSSTDHVDEDDAFDNDDLNEELVTNQRSPSSNASARGGEVEMAALSLQSQGKVVVNPLSTPSVTNAQAVVDAASLREFRDSSHLTPARAPAAGHNFTAKIAMMAMPRSSLTGELSEVQLGGLAAMPALPRLKLPPGVTPRSWRGEGIRLMYHWSAVLWWDTVVLINTIAVLVQVLALFALLFSILTR